MNFDSVPFSAFMDEYVISEAPPDQPPSTFKKFKVSWLACVLSALKPCEISNGASVAAAA